MNRRLLGVAPAVGVAVSLLAATGTSHATHFELADATVADINAAFDAGALTSEALISLYLARIEAYDKQGPKINCVITLNPDALKTARALDRERAEHGPRSPMHGIPVVLKDNIDTADMPTTGGSFVLAGAQPPDDGTAVRRLREAGAIILAKVNLDDFATMGSGFSTVNGQTRNPHNPDYTPAGSSGGSGACVAAWFAPLALGTDTGGSLRSPSSVGGLVGLKPSRGLISRDGVIPTCYTFDVSGPMGRSVYDVAASLGVMTGYDPEDADTQASIGMAHQDYTVFLKTDALEGARIGVLRAGAGVDAEVDAALDQAIDDLRGLGAEVVDPVSYPLHVINGRARRGIMGTVCETENSIYFADYFKTIGPEYPKTMAELAERGLALTEPQGRFAPFPRVYEWVKGRSVGGAAMDSQAYLSAKTHGIAMIQAGVLGVLEKHRLDAMIYPTRPWSPHMIKLDEPTQGPTLPPNPSVDSDEPKGIGLTSIANITGFPDVVVPAGLSAEGLPISISFFGPAFSEPKLLAYAYAYEQATRWRPTAAFTPPLPGESFDY
jgi:amidase